MPNHIYLFAVAKQDIQKSQTFKSDEFDYALRTNISRARFAKVLPARVALVMAGLVLTYFLNNIRVKQSLGIFDTTMAFLALYAVICLLKASHSSDFQSHIEVAKVGHIEAKDVVACFTADLPVNEKQYTDYIVKNINVRLKNYDAPDLISDELTIFNSVGMQRRIKEVKETKDFKVNPERGNLNANDLQYFYILSPLSMEQVFKSGITGKDLIAYSHLFAAKENPKKVVSKLNHTEGKIYSVGKDKVTLFNVVGKDKASDVKSVAIRNVLVRQ